MQTAEELLKSIDFEALEKQAAELGKIVDKLKFSPETSCALEGIWHLCHALLDWHEKQNTEDFWGPVIYEYTDKQAVDDGVLVDISGLGLTLDGKPINRMTGTLYGELEPFVKAEAARFDGNESAALASILRTKLTMRRASDDMYIVPPGLWIMPNEIGSWTDFIRRTIDELLHTTYPDDYYNTRSQTMYVYVARNKVNGKLYVGQTKRTIKQRFHDHLRDAKKPYRHLVFGEAIAEYGIENFEIEILQECSSQ